MFNFDTMRFAPETFLTHSQPITIAEVEHKDDFWSKIGKYFQEEQLNSTFHSKSEFSRKL